MDSIISVFAFILGLLVAGFSVMILSKRHYSLMLKASNNDLLMQLNSSKERLNNREREIAELKVKYVEQQRVLEKNTSLLQESKTAQAVAVEKLERITELETELQNAKNSEQTNQQLLNSYTAEISELKTRLEEQAKQNKDNIKQLDETNAKMIVDFENLANKVLDIQSQKFTEQNKNNINQVLDPLRQQLGDFKKKVEDVYDKETKDRQSLFHEIKSLKDLNSKISEDAINLTNALKGESKTRGNWGEVILERVLEASGLKKGREYDAQDSYRSEDGKLYYPDVIVHLPDNKDVVIDSKVSLNAYDRFYSADDDMIRQAALDEHITSMRNHIKSLSSKNYDDLIGVSSLDMVLMFVPIEPALILAFETDEKLFHEAFTKGIFLVSPSTLTMNLQIIHNMWRYEYQNKNTQEIAKRAGDLYDKFVGFISALDDVGDKIEKAQEAYQTANNRLVAGKGNLVGRTQALKKLGAKTKKSIPEKLLNEVDSLDNNNIEKLNFNEND
ncbi:DNA recombination protein RmuC [hydrothermal vent metagenome]|uniref:DNA recombination protein RmuC n=1 Tax=hydrothermal vent metagenome TaxID=652676 RepID=A0A3B1AEY7_9ZZZZ